MMSALANSNVRLLFGVLCFLISTVQAAAQMPPHPDLVKAIKSGRVAMPYALQSVDQLRLSGIDAPWSSDGLKTRRQAQPGKIMRSFGSEAVPTGAWRALAILVQFNDKPAQVSASSFDGLLFGNYSGSLRDYYKVVSYNNLDLVTVNIPSTLGWATAPQSYSYYVNGHNGMGAYPHNSQRLVEDLVKALDPVIDFSQYDNNHDGFVDALFIVHAGAGAEYSGNNNDIWSQAGDYIATKKMLLMK